MLDCAVFRAFKQQLTKMKCRTPYQERSEWRREMLSHANKAMSKAVEISTVKQAFRVAGQEPMDRTQVLNHENFPCLDQ